MLPARTWVRPNTVTELVLVPVRYAVVSKALDSFQAPTTKPASFYPPTIPVLIRANLNITHCTRYNGEAYSHTYRLGTVTKSELVCTTALASVHCDSGPRAWGSGERARCVFHSSSTALVLLVARGPKRCVQGTPDPPTDHPRHGALERRRPRHPRSDGGLLLPRHDGGHHPRRTDLFCRRQSLQHNRR